MKKSHEFEVVLHFSGYLKKNDIVQALHKFVENHPDNPNNTKIIACALMGHGTSMDTKLMEGDW